MVDEAVAPGAQHPFQHYNYAIPSLPIEEALNQILLWIDVGQPGGIVCGPPRLGKTSALRIMSPLLEHELCNRVPIYTFQCPSERQITQNAFLARLLSDIGHDLASSAKAIVKEERIVKFITLHAKQLGGERAILFIDDAQWLTERGYYWLMDIHNQLDRKQVQLFTILFGQTELIGIRSAYASVNQHQIIGRFMTRIHRFRGLRTVQDVTTIFTILDDSEQHCNASGQTITQAHVPTAFESGWRLQKYDATVWSRFSAFYGDEMSSGVKPELPMGAFAPFCRGLLKQLGRYDQADLQLTEDLIDSLVEATFFSTA